jgi:uncharacterized protein (DUF2237 family)
MANAAADPATTFQSSRVFCKACLTVALLQEGLQSHVEAAILLQLNACHRTVASVCTLHGLSILTDILTH